MFLPQGEALLESTECLSAEVSIYARDLEHVGEATKSIHTQGKGELVAESCPNIIRYGNESSVNMVNKSGVTML